MKDQSKNTQQIDKLSSCRCPMQKIIFKLAVLYYSSRTFPCEAPLDSNTLQHFWWDSYNSPSVLFPLN